MTGRDLLQILFFALFVKPFMALFIGLRVRGKENLPKADPFVLIANHTSHLDTISLLSLFPVTRLRHIHPVAAADYFERNQLIALFTKICFNILPIARKDFSPGNHPLDRMEARLRAGESLIVFPEGTRGSSEEMGPFRSGIARLLERTPEVPVVPAYLVNMG
ncbi:MAG: lysophospholipid acyltransferase family protein, partial [bacterium]